MASARPHVPGLTAVVLALALLLPAAGSATETATSRDGSPGGDAHASSSPLVHLRLLATNDIHDQLTPPHEAYGGAAELATHLKQRKAAHRGALHVDAGDAIGGSGGLSARLGYEPTIEVLNAMGLDVQALGNHEFDAGTAELARRLDGGCWRDDCDYRGGTDFPGASFQALAGNVHDQGTGAPIRPGTWTTTVDGVEIGFIGVTSTNVITGNDGGLDLLDWAEVINESAARLDADGVEVIVVLRHVGTDQGPSDIDECYADPSGRAARFVREDIHPAVDVVVDGHTHRAYVCDESDAPLITQAFHSTMMFTEIDLWVDGDGDVVHRSATNHWVDRDVRPDPDVRAVIDRARSWATGVAGTVTDAETGRAIRGATVTVDGETDTRTDRRGDYRIGGLAPGTTYRVRARAHGYEPAVGSAQVRSGRLAITDLRLTPRSACPDGRVRDAGFTDVTAHAHAVDCLAGWGVTQGVGDGTRFDPSGSVTRAQMASFLARAIRSSGGSLPAGRDAFEDVGGTHADAINQLAAAGIAGGYPDGTYRPSATVTRGQMATFLARSYEHRAGGRLGDAPRSGLSDVAGSTHEPRIDQAVDQGWAQGYDDGTYRPGTSVRRDHMALFITRWLDTLTRQLDLPYPG